MAHIVINKLSMLIVFILATINIDSFAQQTEPAFVYKDSTNKHLSRLDYFLGTFTPVKLDDCFFASGTFKFKVSGSGKITNMEVIGELPDSLVQTIKKRIFETEGKWIFPEQKSHNYISSKWFVLPVFIDKKIGSKCIDDKSIEENYYFLKSLFGNKHKIIETPTSYLINPVHLWGIN